jgi:hypothetical protein
MAARAPAACVGLALALAIAATVRAHDSAETARAPEPGEEVLAALPADRVEELYAKHVVVTPAPEAGSGVARGFVIFEAPIARAFQLLAQTPRQREYRPELTGLETIEVTPDGNVEEYRIRILFLDIRYYLRHRLDRERRRLRWELAPGFENDLARVEGSWELHPLRPDQTLGVLATRVEVGPALPAFLQDYATRKNLPATLERCRRWVDGDGRIDD